MLSEALKDRLSRQTRLSQISEGGDIAFEGEITDDSTAPAAIGAGGGGESEGAVLNRITITVQVRFTNVYDSQWDFAKSFSAYADYDASQMLQNVEGGLIEEIVEEGVKIVFTSDIPVILNQLTASLSISFFKFSDTGICFVKKCGECHPTLHGLLNRGRHNLILISRRDNHDCERQPDLYGF